ncbi:ABC transporter ATP-binding protein, partial [bacterium]|nr:ABC transporter ATP-binding protein [bacterium]
EIDKKFDEIVAFSGIEKFIDTPIKRYSSGMNARLGFSVSAHVDPDILIIDEVLSVGDFVFQEKCIKKMLEYKEKDKTIVFISHNMDSIRKLCNRAILIDKGVMVKAGDLESVINEYYKTNIKSQNGKGEIVKILDAQVLNKNNEKAFVFRSGDIALFKLDILVGEDVEDAIFSVFVRGDNGTMVFPVSSAKLEKRKYRIKKGQSVNICYELKLNLLKGTYTIGFNFRGSIDGKPAGFLQYVNNICSFLIKENISEQGIADLNPTFSFNILTH